MLQYGYPKLPPWHFLVCVYQDKSQHIVIEW
jgi:hypothetical protein